jgi:phosphoheptose isomerase
MFTWQNAAHLISVLYREILAEKQPERLNLQSAAYDATQSPDEEALSAVSQALNSALETLQRSRQVLEESLLPASEMLINCLARGGKIMICGNGGSAADAQHFTAELVGRFASTQRRGLPVIALTADSTFLTAWSNDVGYEKVFARQVEALGRPGDLLIGLSTSGLSRNLLEAFVLAGEMQIETLALLGGDGGDLYPLSDLALVVPSWNTQRIHEMHIFMLHLLCELGDR